MGSLTSEPARDPVARHYDALDLWYRALWGDHLHHGLWRETTRTREEAAGNLLHAIAEAGHLGPGCRVCDVGCGYGGPARWLAATTGSEITGITNSPAQAAFAKSVAAPGVEIRLAHWLANELPDQAFDAVLAIESLAHFSDPARAIEEMLRVLKPGGRGVIATWIAGDDVPRWANRFLLDPIRRTGESPGLANEASHRNWIVDTGAILLSRERLGPRVHRTWSNAMRSGLKALLTNRALRADALRHPLRAGKLATSSIRIWLAYRLGFLDYDLLTFSR